MPADAMRTEASRSQLRKSRGAFFTPALLATYLARWAVWSNPEAIVLDPTCGDGELLMAAGHELRGLRRNRHLGKDQLHGIDIDQESLNDAGVRLIDAGYPSTLRQSDFFSVPAPGLNPEAAARLFDAVVGNPPFIRFHDHAGLTRQRALEAALGQGVQLNGRASSWAAALIHASGFLSPDGRLAMVLPSELLSVDYAEPVRRWLLRRFASLDIITFNRQLFPDASADVILVLAEGSGGTSIVHVSNVHDADDLKAINRSSRTSVKPPAAGKWSAFLLPADVRDMYLEVSDQFTTLGEIADITLGTVTGANHYFAISESERVTLGLLEDEVLPVVPTGARQLVGNTFLLRDWQALRAADKKVWLFHPVSGKESSAARAYIEEGKIQQVDQTYKSRKRTPWWLSPYVVPPDFFLTYMSHHHVRLVANDAGVGFFNSLLGVTALPGEKTTGLNWLMLNSVTLLGAELLGRSYGGGVLKLEIGEARKLAVPSSEARDEAHSRLKDSVDSLERHMRSGQWHEVVSVIDSALLRDTLSFDARKIKSIRDAGERLRRRRQMQ